MKKYLLKEEGHYTNLYEVETESLGKDVQLTKETFLKKCMDVDHGKQVIRDMLEEEAKAKK